ncbi:MAG: zinc ribbon domain-containing protein [Oscillospiraceae bacterium]|nr:zinc ribbon domain-containing protein [Oscillospiraceae bacterium]
METLSNFSRKTKKAPARSKSVEEFYLLTTKLFCGHCKSAMVGICGTSKTGKIHQYYQCVNNRKKACKMKSVKKFYIEDLIVEKVISILTDEVIDKIAQNICELSEKESNTDILKRLKKKIRKNETATENLIKALESGKATDIISAQIEKRQLEKQDLQAQFAREKILKPQLKFAQVKFFFDRFKKGDVNGINFRRSLIDTFINKIYLYDSKLHIFCNVQDSKIEMPLDKLKSSSNGRVVERAGFEPA